MKKLFTFAMAVMASTSLWAVNDDIDKYVGNNANFMGVLSQSRWCDHNSGTSDPKAYGDYYQWGNIHTQGTYNAASYGNMYTEINTTDIAGWYANPHCWDVAMCYGETWLKSPTKAQWEELMETCTWTWSDDDNAYYVQGPSGSTIILPAAGYKDGRNAKKAGTDGYYWTTTRNEANTNEAYCLHFTKDVKEIITMDRALGLSVRPGIPGYIFDEEATVSPVPLGQYNVFATLKTTADEDEWRPLCVPFVIANEPGQCNVADIVSKIAVFKGIENGVAKFESLGADGTIACGTPYLVLPASAYNSPMGNRLIDGDGSVKAVTEGNATFQGAYHKTTAPAGAYVFNGYTFEKSNGSLEVLANTAYITTTDASLPQTLKCSIDGQLLSDPTGIAVMKKNGATIDVFNLQGVRVKAGVKAEKALEGLPSGLYIAGGRKVIK